MLGAPGTDAFNFIGAAEVVLVLRLAQPAGLGLAFAFTAASRLGAKNLVPAITSIRSKQTAAIYTLTKTGGRRHSGRKKIDPMVNDHLEANRHPERAEADRRRKRRNKEEEI